MDATVAVSPLGVRERWLTTGLLGMGLIAFAINASTTNLILSKLMTSLRVELYHIHWVITAFGIARTVTIPTLGWLSGRVGPRTLYLICLGTFSLGTLGSALAWDWSSLILFRILTGAGGGMIPPLSMAIFYQIFPPNQRGMALGLSLMGWSIGPSIGPLMGGYLLEFASWRVVYVMILPLSGLGFVLAWWFLPLLRRPEQRRLDQYGLLSMAVAVATLLLALSQGRREGWDSQYILMLFIIAVIAAGVFIIIELRHTEPLVELRLFGSLPFVMAMLVMFLTTMAFRSTGPMIPVLMQRILGFEPLLVAWTMMPANIIYGMTVLLAGRLSDRLPPQLLVVVGLAMYATTFIGYSGVNAWTTALTMTTFLSFRFIAEGLIVSPNNLTALRALPESQVMMASGLIGLLRSIANTLGPAVSAVLWDQRFGRHIQYYAESSPVDSFGFTMAMRELQNMLIWGGEIATQISTKSMALMQRRLQAEASTAAWQDYLLYNALMAIFAVLPALLVGSGLWRFFHLLPPTTRSAAKEVAHSAPAGASAPSPGLMSDNRPHRSS
jgi:EmrB/QacA subfamily drug resistance transporter